MALMMKQTPASRPCQHAGRRLAAAFGISVAGLLGGCYVKEFEAPPPSVYERRIELPADQVPDLAKAHFRADDFVEVDDEESYLDIRGDFLFLKGVINSDTYADVIDMLAAHPNIQSLVLTDVPGSADDEANLALGRVVRKAGLITYLPAEGLVASGGTDLFLSGAKRVMGRGARVGVHSWGDDDITGNDLPRDDPEHERYLSYYREIGIPEQFYWFTLEAAPADDIHWMTEAELAKHAVYTLPPVD